MNPLVLLALLGGGIFAATRATAQTGGSGTTGGPSMTPPQSGPSGGVSGGLKAINWPSLVGTCVSPAVYSVAALRSGYVVNSSPKCAKNQGLVQRICAPNESWVNVAPGVSGTDCYPWMRKATTPEYRAKFFAGSLGKVVGGAVGSAQDAIGTVTGLVDGTSSVCSSAIGSIVCGVASKVAGIAAPYVSEASSTLKETTGW